MRPVIHLRRSALIAILAIGLAIGASYVRIRPEVPKPSLPTHLSDAEFWKIIEDFSEPGGYFRSDNFVSNESTFQTVVPDLHKQTRAGGIYVGVGPDQNFTYLVAVDPAFAFIVDIRRQNLIEHLMYKALFELSRNRREFLSRLFARPVPPDLARAATLEELFDIFEGRESDSAFARATLAEVTENFRLHHFTLSESDLMNLEYVYNAFAGGGPQIRYSFPNQYSWRRFPSYSELMLETDGEGENHSYMASEENFEAMKKLESENRVIPIVGDFAGDKALRSVGRYLKQHGATVTTFYTSNVEFYLFQSDDWKKFYSNVASFPTEADSVFIRAYFNNYGLRFPTSPSARSVTLLDSIPGTVAAFQSGKVRTYFDVIRRSGGLDAQQ